MIVLLLQAAERPDSSLWGIVVPGVIFIVAFMVTMMLYRHFSKDRQG